MTASELYAISQSTKCGGDDECYWCGSPCTKAMPHWETPAVAGTNTPRKFAARPGNQYMCVGCWMWRRRRVTAQFVGGGFKDGQAINLHSWWITTAGAYAIRQGDETALYDRLLAPPGRFCLALLEGGCRNEIQLMTTNDLKSVTVETPLAFTINNVRQTYTVYELEEGLTYGTEGKMPGVRELIRILGAYTLPEVRRQPEGRGRPPAKETAVALQTPPKDRKPAKK